MTAATGLGVHANAVVIAEHGLLIRGPSGAGKSALSRALIDEAALRGLFSALVADDRVLLRKADGRLIASTVPGFEGWIERRGEGLIRAPHEPSVVIRGIVELAPHGRRLPRWPEREARVVEILGVGAPAFDLDLGEGPQAAAIATLRRFGLMV